MSALRPVFRASLVTLLFNVLVSIPQSFAVSGQSPCEQAASKHRALKQTLLTAALFTGISFALEPSAEAALKATIAQETEFALQLWNRNLAWAQHSQVDLQHLDYFLHSHVLPKPLGSPLSQDAWRDANMVYLVERALIQSVDGITDDGLLQSPLRNQSLMQIEQDPFALILIQLHKDHVLSLAEVIRYLDLGVARPFGLMKLHIYELPSSEAQADFLLQQQNLWVKDIATERSRRR